MDEDQRETWNIYENKIISATKKKAKFFLNTYSKYLPIFQ